MIHGQCLCGDIAWEADDPVELISHCHCSRCRKAHGSAFATYGSVRDAGFRWTRGEGSIANFESSPGFRRPFCPRCGSVVAGDADEGLRSMPVGCVDGDPGGRPAAHIFARWKAPWHRIADELPQFDFYPPGFEGNVVAPESRGSDGEGEIAGSCLCGDVRYALEAGALEVIVDCHCGRCRKARSAAHATNGFAPASGFRWISGADRLTHYKVSDADRFATSFCRRCGSCMPRASEVRVMVPAGSLDDDPGIREGLRIFYGSRATWYEPLDELPRFEEGPGSSRA